MIELTSHAVTTAFGLAGLCWLSIAVAAPGLFRIPCVLVAGYCLAEFWGLL